MSAHNVGLEILIISAFSTYLSQTSFKSNHRAFKTIVWLDDSH